MRGDCQRDFQQAATDAGIELVGQSFAWLCRRWHLALPPDAAPAAEVLEGIYLALGGDLAALGGAPATKLTGDFLHGPTGTLIEVDEVQHFTSARLTTLELYPADARVGYDLERYRSLCLDLHGRADRAFAHKRARGLGVGGRQRQRAYYDALRDLAAPAMGHPPLIRADCLDGDGRGAWQRVRHLLA